MIFATAIPLIFAGTAVAVTIAAAVIMAFWDAEWWTDTAIVVGGVLFIGSAIGLLATLLMTLGGHP